MADDTDQARPVARVFGWVASVVRWAGLAIAVILAIHVLLTIGNANPDNGITTAFRSWSGPLALGFKDLFLATPDDDPKLRVLVNYGIAALFWLIVSGLLARILRRVT
jgi:hypothetical protein